MNNQQAARLPAIFIGHGSPMNALEDSVYTRAWQQIAASIPHPKAILAISAHWYTHGTAVTANSMPPTIHDFRGFPQALFDIRYPAPGSPALATRVRELLAPVEVHLDEEWGLDHGAWSILVKMYPEADVPVVQLSVDADRPPAYHLELGHSLARLREEGVLVMASGNVVHNLRTMRWGSNEAYDWAARFNDEVRTCLLAGDVARLATCMEWGDHARLSVPTPEHFLPLLYIAGMLQPGESLSVPVDGIEMGSISMLTAVVGGEGLSNIANA